MKIVPLFVALLLTIVSYSYCYSLRSKPQQAPTKVTGHGKVTVKQSGTSKEASKQTTLTKITSKPSTANKEPTKPGSPSKALLQKYGAISRGDKNGPGTKERDDKAAVQAELMLRVEGYRERCYPMPKDGCSCIEPRRVKRYDTDAECRGKLPQDLEPIGPIKPSTNATGYPTRPIKPVESCKRPVKGPSKNMLEKYGALGNDTDGPTTKERDAKAEVQEELMERVRGYRRKCYPMPVDGCKCDEIRGPKRYATDEECRRKPKEDEKLSEPTKKPIGPIGPSKKPIGPIDPSKNASKPTGPSKVPAKGTRPSKDILQKYGALGNDTDGPTTKERNDKADVQEELMERVRGYRRKCYPMPVDGCRCDEIRGPKRYATDEECRRKPHNDTLEAIQCTLTPAEPVQKPTKPPPGPGKETSNVTAPSKKLLQKYGAINKADKKGPTTKERDEKAAMQAELMARVEGYREKCYPMPKDGCSCVERRGVIRYERDIECRK